jgi:hypothetical protein
MPDIRQAHKLEETSDLVCRSLVSAQPISHVLQYRKMRKQSPLLEDHADLSLFGRHPSSLADEYLASKPHAPLLRSLEPSHGSEKRRLATTTGTNERRNAFGLDIQAGTRNRAHRPVTFVAGLTIANHQITNLQDGARPNHLRASSPVAPPARQ